MRSKAFIALLGGCVPVTPSDQLVTAPAVGAGDSAYLLAWADLVRTPAGDVTSSRILATRVGTDGAPFGNVSLIASTSQDPAVAWDGARWVVVTAGSATLVGADGTLAGAVGLPASSTADVACSGTTCLIVQGGATAITGLRIDATGNVDATPLAIGAGVSPRVAFDGTQFWVVWQVPGADQHVAIEGARVSDAGALLDPQPVIIEPKAQGAPAIACGTGTCLVGYDGGLARRVSMTGAVLDASPIEMISSCSIDRLGMAFDGASFIAGGACYQSTQGVRGARVSTTGAVLGGGELAISATASQTIAFSIAAIAGRALATWEDRRDGEDLFGARIDSNGVVLDPDGLHLAASGEPAH